MDALGGHLEGVLEAQGHAVVCIAEGAAQVRQWGALGGMGRTWFAADLYSMLPVWPR